MAGMADSIIMVVLLSHIVQKVDLYSPLNSWRVGGFFCFHVIMTELRLDILENVFIVLFPSILKSSCSLKISG